MSLCPCSCNPMCGCECHAAERDRRLDEDQAFEEALHEIARTLDARWTTDDKVLRRIFRAGIERGLRLRGYCEDKDA